MGKLLALQGQAPSPSPGESPSCAQSPAWPSPHPCPPHTTPLHTHTPPEPETKAPNHTPPIIGVPTVAVLPENQPRKPEVGEDREGRGGGTPCPWIDSEPTAHNPVKILILIYPGGEAAVAEIKPLRSNKRRAADKVGRPLLKSHSAKVSQRLTIREPPPGLWPQEPATGARRIRSHDCGEGQPEWMVQGQRGGPWLS